MRLRFGRLAIVLGLIAVGGLGFHWCRNEVRIDECIDSGGRWGGTQCEH